MMVAGPPDGVTSVREEKLRYYSRGDQGVASCNVDKYDFYLSTQAHDHVWDLVEYKQVEPAHCPTGATSGGTGYACNGHFNSSVNMAMSMFKLSTTPRWALMAARGWARLILYRRRDLINDGPNCATAAVAVGCWPSSAPFCRPSF
jgi:hypothetical protein